MDFPVFYGKVPIGTKGQIVIPAEARKAMKIKPGDNVIIMSTTPHQKEGIVIFPEENFYEFMKLFEERMDSMKKEIMKKK